MKKINIAYYTLTTLLLFQLKTKMVSAQRASEYLDDINATLGFDRYNVLTQPGTIIFDLLKYLLVFAGLILFFMIIAGGYQLMFGAGDPKQAEMGKTRITQALIGFIIIFTSYWITQIVEVILGINIF